MELKPCPFCKSDRIGYSIKTSSYFYHVAMFCEKCHTYGPRTIIKGMNRPEIETREDVKLKAIESWNERRIDEVD